MQKSFLALPLLACLVSTAGAQSSVTLYGKVDLGMVVDHGNPNGRSIRLTSGVTGGSRIGFKGVEDLGGGYKAAFQLETGYCGDSAASGSFCTGPGFMGRQAHGDLTGAFGAVSGGRQYSLGFLNLATIDPFGSGLAGQASNSDGKGNYLVDVSNIRINNSVIYTTPVLAGVTASGEVSFGETTGNWKAGRELGAAVNYASGPAYAGLTLYSADNANGVGVARRNVILGGTVDWGVVKLHALGQKVSGVPTGAARLDIVNFLLGATVPLASGSVLASVIRHDDRTALNRDALQWGTAYLYPLSKRTYVYTSYGRVNNQRGGALLIGNASEAGTGSRALDIGVSHNF